MTDFTKKPIKVKGSILDKVLLRQRILWIRLVLEDESKKIILNFWNVFYLSNSPFNLISLSFLNDVNIYYNKQQTLYDKANQKSLLFTQK